ncbi:hypothetical protein [Oceanidesulfovibrio marinus]|uniref:hypothetical protein n=1 Tax=Oceanidesulfovibrio marinus TaxID=370038 RepID=UPI001185A94A|nr:hypothetical protein [Oceanidesulfovibrio marinus]
MAPEDEAQLHALVKNRLESLKNEYPSTPLLALSGLAEGADMVFAEAALELGMELVAVLPAPREVFARDFQKPTYPARTAEDLTQRFHNILARCSDRVVVGEGRHAQEPDRYTYVGAYLVRRCHVLFALWGGAEPDSEGGTGHVVKLAREGVPNRYRESPLRALDSPDPVTIHHLISPRKGAAVENAFTWKIMEPAEWAAGACRAMPANPLSALESFNKEACAFAARHPNAIEQSKGYLGLPEEELTRAERRIVHGYAIADAMAVDCRDKSNRTLLVIYGISLFMLLGFAVYSNVFPHTWLHAVYYVAFLLGCGLYVWDKWKRVHMRYVNYRGLAEGLRVQLFYRLAGVRNLAADLYLRKQRHEMAWIRQAMRALEAGPRRNEPQSAVVLTRWIKDQADFFKGARVRDAKKIRWFTWYARVGFWAGLFCGLLGLFVEIGNYAAHDSILLHWLFMLMGVFPAIAALIGSYVHRRGLEQHVREYDKMGAMFCQAAELVECDGLMHKNLCTHEEHMPERQKHTGFQLLVRELGREALADNAQWLMLHRELPPTLPSS